MISKRVFDILFSISSLIFLSPLFFFLIVLLLAAYKKNIFFTQVRIGLNGKEFKIFKFRSMVISENTLLSVTADNKKITKIGYYLRRYKLDELPQLINVILGDMSVVGPRAESAQLFSQYRKEEKELAVTIKPGISFETSIKYFNIDEYLSKFKNPTEVYFNRIVPEKIKNIREYHHKQSILFDVGIILKTIQLILRLKK